MILLISALILSVVTNIRREILSEIGTKDFVGPNERGGRARGTFQFRARGRGWGRGNYSGNNNNNNNNNDFQKRIREEEWDPEYTPKSKKYYLHDDREGEGSDKWMSRGHGRGAFPRGRGRFMFRKSSTSSKWTHDKFGGEEGEIEDDENGAENREDKDSLQSRLSRVTLDGALAQGERRWERLVELNREPQEDPANLQPHRNNSRVHIPGAVPLDRGHWPQSLGSGLCFE
ncbi:Thyroid hormone receptor-associated protein 3 [Lemmus lemmus]